VFVFAGNAQLEDTTVANDDYINPAQHIDLWGITVYPNPMPKGEVTLNICFKGAGYSKTNGNLKAVLYNIKGQKIDSYRIPGSDIRRKIWTHTLKKCPAGEYLIAVLDGSNRLITHKFIVE